MFKRKHQQVEDCNLWSELRNDIRRCKLALYQPDEYMTDIQLRNLQRQYNKAMDMWTQHYHIQV